MAPSLLFPVLLLSLVACQNSHVIKKADWPRPLLANTTYQLTDEAGQQQDLNSLLQGHRGLVLWFWQIRCPCVARYQKRFEDLKAKFTPRGIRFVLVDSSPMDSPADIAQKRQELGMVEPVLQASQGLAARLNIKGTPSVALIAPDGTVVYVGWVDNERAVGEKYREAYLEMALDQFLKGQSLTRPTSPMFGCPLAR
jgi:hypothetical protein